MSEQTEAVAEIETGKSENQESTNASEEYAYLDRGGFSSEKFKIELRGLPKFYGIAELKKLMNNKLGLNTSKIKRPKNGSHWLYACFQNDEERTKAITSLNGYSWKVYFRERKSDEEWIALNKLKLPVLLNYAQCKLVKGDYYHVIEHCNTVLEYDKDNEKALYRRAKANLGAWNPDAAEYDFKRLKTINPTLSATVDKELENIRNLRKQKEEEDKNALRNLFDKNNETS